MLSVVAEERRATRERGGKISDTQGSSELCAAVQRDRVTSPIYRARLLLG